jgi:hypothetical protein
VDNDKRFTLFFTKEWFQAKIVFGEKIIIWQYREAIIAKRLQVHSEALKDCPLYGPLSPLWLYVPLQPYVSSKALCGLLSLLRPYASSAPYCPLLGSVSSMALFPLYGLLPPLNSSALCSLYGLLLTLQPSVLSTAHVPPLPLPHSVLSMVLCFLNNNSPLSHLRLSVPSICPLYYLRPSVSSITICPLYIPMHPSLWPSSSSRDLCPLYSLLRLPLYFLRPSVSYTAICPF